MPTRPIHVRLRPVAEGRIHSGHPWIFSNSIATQDRPGITGELVTVFDRHDKLLALGFYDALSPIRVRVIHTGKPRQINLAFWEDRLRLAMQKRDSLLGPSTNGCRLVHGESDGFPGLVLDQYDHTLVIKLYSAIWFPRFHEILPIILHVCAPQRLILRLSRNLQESAQLFNLNDGAVIHGQALEAPVTFQENGLTFEADVIKGQKTGFFLDQRENRQRVEKLATGKNVLNAFSFSGGFSLYAARGGARSVTDMDISAHALQSSRRNFALNIHPNITKCEHITSQADVFEKLLVPSPKKFGLVILDPPSLAMRESDRLNAIKAYENLARSGINCLSSGGILVAASCSAHVTPDEFFKAVHVAAKKTGLHFTEIERALHPADHPASFPEAIYLKCIYLRFTDVANASKMPIPGKRKNQPHR